MDLSWHMITKWKHKYLQLFIGYFCGVKGQLMNKFTFMVSNQFKWLMLSSANIKRLISITWNTNGDQYIKSFILNVSLRLFEVVKTRYLHSHRIKKINCYDNYRILLQLKGIVIEQIVCHLLKKICLKKKQKGLITLIIKTLEFYGIPIKKQQQRIATGLDNNFTLILFKFPNNQSTKVLTGYQQPFYHVELSLHGRYAISASFDKSVGFNREFTFRCHAHLSMGLLGLLIVNAQYLLLNYQLLNY